MGRPPVRYARTEARDDRGTRDRRRIWQPLFALAHRAWPAFTAFAASFILARLFLGHLADRFAAPKVALLSVLVESAGLVLLAIAPSLAAALAGAALTGFGYSLVYPALGVEAVRSVPSQNHGLAMWVHSAFGGRRQGRVCPHIRC
jgi:MFS family permease